MLALPEAPFSSPQDQLPVSFKQKANFMVRIKRNIKIKTNMKKQGCAEIEKETIIERAEIKTSKILYVY